MLRWVARQWGSWTERGVIFKCRRNVERVTQDPSSLDLGLSLEMWSHGLDLVLKS